MTSARAISEDRGLDSGRTGAAALTLACLAVACGGGGSGGETGPNDNSPPSASITSPAEGDSFSELATVELRGSATDPEEGDLAGTSLVWTSDLDGRLGTGESVTPQLSVGSHQIRFVATDSEGASDTAIVSIGVDEAQASDVEVRPEMSTLRVGGTASLTATAVTSAGDTIPDPNLSVQSRDASVAAATEASDVRVDGQSAGVADVVVTAIEGGASDSTRSAVVESDGFAAVVSPGPEEFFASSASGTTVGVGLIFVRPPDGTGTLGSVEGTLEWDASRLAYEGSQAVESGWTWTVNEGETESGRLHFSAFAAEGTSATFRLAGITFTATGSSGDGPADLDLIVDTAGDEQGNDITARVHTAGSAVEIE